MVQLLLLLTMIPVALWLLRLFFAVFKSLVAMIIIMSLLGLMALFGSSNHSKSTNEKLPMPAVSQDAEVISSYDCSDIERVLSEQYGALDLCDRFYKGELCRTEIEMVFNRLGVQLSPADKCGIPIRKIDVEPVPSSLDEIASAFTASTTPVERSEWIKNLHNLLSSKTSLTLQDIRSTEFLPVFVAFAKPTGDALQKLDSLDLSSGSVTLKRVPLLTPFSGIVRGVYKRDEKNECSIRLRDHSLCIQRNDTVSCNVFNLEELAQEQVCVDYLIR
jgi:hypothetical protein